MDSMIPNGQRNTLAEYMILSGAENHPLMLDKDLYDSWKSRMELYIQNREHGRMILKSVEHMHRGIAWDKVENPDPQSTLQVLPSFEEYTSPATYPEEVEETLGILIEVKPLDETPLEDLGLNTYVSLGEERGPEPPIKPHSPDSFKMKEVDRLTINTPPSHHVASSHPKDMYCYYRPCIDDPKKYYGFKPGLLRKSASLGVDILNWEMFNDDWGLESKEVSPLGKELSLFDRPNEVERGRILEAHRLESILQQQISQHMAHSHHDGILLYKPAKPDKLYLMRRSLEVLRKFHWMILGGRSNQLSHVSSPLLSKPGEY
ncbi:hypothetical protein Tco_1363549 [Tanacetum coccineum]